VLEGIVPSYVGILIGAGETGRARLGADSDRDAPEREVRFAPDSAEKVFLGAERKFLKVLMCFARGDEGPHRFTQKRPRSFVGALRSIAVVEPAKNQLLLDFRK
jgi:hypothetical protein